MPDDYTKNTARATAAPCDELHLDHPPAGIKMERTYDGTTAITIRMFTPAAFGTLVFTLLWNGLTSLFVCIAISLTAEKFGWDKFLIFEIENAKTNAWWFVWLFMTPFIAVGIWTIRLAIFHFFGQYIIKISPTEGSVFKGIGSFGRTQRFSPKSVKPVKMPKFNDNNPGGQLVIQMNNGREIKFLAMFSEMRKTWLVFALNKLLNLGKGTTP